LYIVFVLEEANLRGANLRRASLQHTNLRDTRLQEANLRGANLEQADLRGANLQNADLQEAVFDGGTRLSGVVLGEASVADLKWGESNLAVVEWTHVNMLGDESEALQVQTPDGDMKTKLWRIADYRTAVRANRQLAVVLRNQGLDEEADHFAYRAQRLQRIVLRRQGLLPNEKGRRKTTLWPRVRKLSAYAFSGFLDILAGYGYRPGRTLFSYLFVIMAFTTAYAIFGHLPPIPDALVFSFMSFHGRGFFTSLSGETNLHNPIVVLAAAEAVTGLFIEVSFIATFTQRFFGR
jgi:hypothetical protein